jgi:hypothetical protein
VTAPVPLRPFRWDVSRREQLGRLLIGPRARTYRGFMGDLLRCSAGLLDRAGNADLVFVGRSPESLFDLLSGLLADTSWRGRLALLNVSLGGTVPRAVPALPSGTRAAIRRQLRAVGLTPAQLVARPRPIALVDVVVTGDSLGSLLELVVGWARETRVDEAAVRRRLRVVGLTPRQPTNPHTWRWQQRAAWVAGFPRSALQGLAIPWRLFSYLANWQAKVTPANPPSCWASEELGQPPRSTEHHEALRLARWLYAEGTTRARRRQLVRWLARQPAMRERWLRALVSELRGRAVPGPVHGRGR